MTYYGFLRMLKRLFKRPEAVDNIFPDGRHNYLYIEGDYRASIGQDQFDDPTRTLLDRATLKYWLPPHESEPISEEKQNEIIELLCEFVSRSHSNPVVINSDDVTDHDDNG